MFLIKDLLSIGISEDKSIYCIESSYLYTSYAPLQHLHIKFV
jgi:hypothetical protein